MKKLRGNIKDLTGVRFGYWTAVELSGTKTNWRCVCKCGNTREVCSRALLSGHSKSCGCYKVEMAKQRGLIHGYSKNTPEYYSWAAMKGRCNDKKSVGYRNYGGRGIRVCERWNNFANFIADMGPKPSPKHTLDRYPDNNGNYEPGNARWATKKEQGSNKRGTIYVTLEGVKKPLIEWCELKKFKYQCAADRIRLGWPLDETLFLPPSGSNRLSNILKAKK